MIKKKIGEGLAGEAIYVKIELGSSILTVLDFRKVAWKRYY